MARSYKKFPGWKHTERGGKRFANITVRHFRGRVHDPEEGDRDIPDGGAYRKLYDSWEICDGKDIFYTKVAFQDHIDKILAEWKEDQEKGLPWSWWRRTNEKEMTAFIGRPKRK